MRSDAVGLFWDEPDYKTQNKTELLIEEGWIQVFPGFWAVKRLIDKGANPREVCLNFEEAHKQAKGDKSGPKAEPPEAIWLKPDYLPGLEECRKYKFDLMTNDEIISHGHEGLITGQKHPLIFDIECSGNYFLIMFMSAITKKIIYEEMSDASPKMNTEKLQWIFDNFTVIGFNSSNYDIPIASIAVKGASTARLKSATSAIIVEKMRYYDVLKMNKCKKLKGDHIDLMEVAPLSGNLKIYGGRIHTKKMQDLPFHPDTILSPEQVIITRRYCINDLQNTLEMYDELNKPLALREKMGNQYSIDLRSKSDAQIAESVITSEVTKLNGTRCTRNAIEPGTSYKFNTPSFIKFKSAHMQHILNIVETVDYVVGDKGAITLPKDLTKAPIKINQTEYKLGIGGIHSKDKSMSHYSDNEYFLVDKDVTSYYPIIIINQMLYPQHLGPNFLVAYEKIVDTRLAAKASGNKSVADSLKIVINGSFGKFGSPYSMLYSPQLLIQTTLTGQLSLLMLVERLELAGILVVSANTDGVVIKCKYHQKDLMESICAQWQADTQFNLEDTHYASLHSKDVNNYIAVYKEEDRKTNKPEDSAKLKGCFGSPGLSKNPQNEICMESVRDFIIYNKPIEESIRSCNDFRKFLTVRNVKGGGVKLRENEAENLYLGKVVRFYYSVDNHTPIVYAKSGNRVSASMGAEPAMDLPDSFPTNINYEHYIQEAEKLVENCGLVLN